MRTWHLLLALLFGGHNLASADTLADGQTGYLAGEYETALKHFLDAQISIPDEPLLDLRLGATYYKMERYDEAAQALMRALRTDDQGRRGEVLYNLGNTAYKQGKLKEAIEYYIQAQDLRPEDEDVKYNLEFVREELRRLIEQQKQQQKDQQQKDQQQKDQQQKDQQQKDQQQHGADGQSDQQGQPRPQPGQQQDDGQTDQGAGPQPRPRQGQPMNKEQAEQLLRRLQEQPPRPQVKAQGRYRPQKDW